MWQAGIGKPNGTTLAIEPFEGGSTGCRWGKPFMRGERMYWVFIGVGWALIGAGVTFMVWLYNGGEGAAPIDEQP